MTSTTPTLNIIDINELLFENTNGKITNNKPNTKSNEFNFAQVWGEIDGEYNQVSEFVEACKLIVSNNAIAAAIALNEQSSISSSNKEQDSLNSFIGDITPAVTAVANSVVDSPMMNTPYLDNSCMGTPFTPASVFTPSLNQFHNNSPYYSPYIDTFQNMNSSNDDIQVANYLKNDFASSSSWHTPATTVTTTDLFPSVSNTPAIAPELFDNNFNGDPTQLLLDTTTNNNVTATVDDSSAFDSLFPPLPSDNVQQPIYQLNTNIQQNLFNNEEFEAGNFFDDCFDDCFFNMQDDNAAPSTILLDNKKRKLDNDSTTKKNKRVKISPVSTTDGEERKFECDICHMSFNRRYNLGTHIKTHDKNRSKDFACHLCLKPFDRKHDLTRHVATVHNGERAYNCNTCTSTFSRKDALVRHQLQKHQIQQA
jgi:uncharacterized C2H2 Zn-finger protein